MSGSGVTPHEVGVFIHRLARSIANSGEDQFVGAYLHGSAAWGGWVPERSDVDVLFVMADTVPAEQLLTVECALVESAAVCPGAGLECSVVSSTQARDPRPPWPFLLHVQASQGEPIKTVSGASVEGDPDLLMHYAVCRRLGGAVLGPSPEVVFGPVSRHDILDYLASELTWGLEHGSEAYAVLNACRASVYVRRGELVSKIEGGRRALSEGWAPPDVVTRALRQQQALMEARQIAPDAIAFVGLVREQVLTVRDLPPES